MAVKAKEYMLSIDNLSRPKIVEGTEAIATLIIRLLLLNPGADPLHPEMGVGLEDFRFCIDRIQELEERIKDQMAMYLPEFAFSNVKVVEITAEKICNIEITVGNTVFVYDSRTMPVQLSLNEFAI